MKKLAWVFSVLMILSCKNETTKNMIETSSATEAVEDISLIETAKPSAEIFKYQELSTIKLQELYDLLTLKHEHPEFKESIESQLKNYTNDIMINSNKSESLIKNIKLKGDLIKVSDSVQKMKLYYDIVSNSLIQKDSIWAEVTTNHININGKKIESKKIKFTTNPH